MSDTRFFPFGAYNKLDSQQQAVVDSILLSEVIFATAKARTKPETANELEHAFKAILEAYTANNTAAGNGDACLSLNRDFLAGHPEAIHAVQAVLVQSNVTPQLLQHFTHTINRMVALDGHSIKLSD